MFTYTIVGCAFLLGFALARTSTCSVAATRRLVVEKKADWLFGLLIAVSWSALTILLVGLLQPSVFVPPPSVDIGLYLVVGGLIMGVGAFLNQACFIGTVGRISAGNLSYILTFFGLAASEYFGPTPIWAASDNGRSAVTFVGARWGILEWAMIGVFVVVACLSLRRLKLRYSQAILALCVVGVTAALIYIDRSDWSYQRLLGRIEHGEGFSRGYVIELTVLALFAGAIISSALRDRFQLHFSGWLSSAMNFFGGLFMGIGAQIIPGGNDTMLLWLIPNLAVHAVVAYFAMLCMVALLILTMRYFGLSMRSGPAH